MEIVIKIPDKLYEYIVKGKDLSEEQNDEMALAIADGKPLPEHHGRLIDADVLEEIKEPVYEPNGDMKGYGVLMSDIREFAPTIIKADKGNKKWKDF